MSLPTTAEPSELFAKLTSTTRPHRVVDLPRKGPDGQPVGRVAIVPLTQSEMISASAESERRTRDILGKSFPKKDEDRAGGVDDVYNNIAACEILFRACKSVDDPDVKKGAFKTPNEIASAFTNDEIGVLYHHYSTVRIEVGPIISQMDDGEIDAWIAVLAEGSSALPLDGLSWGALTALVLSMASRLHSSATVSSSPGLHVDLATELPDSTEY